MRCINHFCPGQEVRPSLTEEDIQCGSKKREHNELRRKYIRKKIIVIETWNCDWWKPYKITTDDKLHILENIPHRPLLTKHQFLEEIGKIKRFGYLNCLKIWQSILPTSFQSSRTLQLARMIYRSSWKTMAKKKTIVSTSGIVDIRLHIKNGNLITSPVLF